MPKYMILLVIIYILKMRRRGIGWILSTSPTPPPEGYIPKLEIKNLKKFKNRPLYDL